MATKPSSLPWDWAIETLASWEEVDTSDLIDMVKFDDLGKSARERVSLRILERFFVLGNRNPCAFSSVRDSNIRFDPSELCEDVLRRVVSEVSAYDSKIEGLEMLKRGLHPFIVHKKASLPISALKRLKDAILKGSNPTLASLKERSGLATKDRCENRIPMDDSNLDAIAQRPGESCTGSQMVEQRNIASLNVENREGIVLQASPGKIVSLSNRDKSDAIENWEGMSQEDSPDRSISLSKGDRSEAIANRENIMQEDSPDRSISLSKRTRSEAIEDPGAQFHEDQIGADKGQGSHLNAAKRLKRHETCIGQTIGENLVPLRENELLGNPSGRIGHGREVSDLSKGSHENTRSKSIGVSIDGNNEDIPNNHLQISSNDNEITRDKSGDGEIPNISVVEAKDDEHSAEMRVSNDAPKDINHENKFVNKVRVDCPDGSLRKSIDCEPNDNMDHNCEGKSFTDSESHHYEMDIAIKKRSFLSSQCALSQDSLAMLDLTETSHCMKCNKSGDLLVCSSRACPIGVHESCLGSAASFDESGNFLCPFCAYYRVISEYLEFKKKVSTARKDMATFISLGGESQLKKHIKKLHRSDQNNEANKNINEVFCPTSRTDIVDIQVEPSVSRVNGDLPHGGNGPEVDCPTSRTEIVDIQVEPSVPCVNVNLPCGGNGAEIDCPTSRTDIVDIQVEPSVSCVNGNLPCFGNGAETTIDNGTHHVPVIVNQVGGNVDPDCQSARAPELQRGEAPGDHNHDGDNLSSGDMGIVHDRDRDALPQPTTIPPLEAASPPNNEAEGSLEEENEKSTTSSYSIRVRKPKKQNTCPAIHQLRRKKVPWTDTEEKILKEGVRRFGRHHAKMPWTQILEFGSNVFQGRTGMDLKDKWRNMSKGRK